MTAAAATAAFNAATSGPSSTDGSAAASASGGAWTNTDPSAQALTASAMAAAAAGAAPVDAAFAGAADSPSSPADALAPAAMGGAARGGARSNGAPPAALAVSVPAAAAAKAAANASANASAADALADLGKADSRAPGAESSLSDTSGNAAAGAAQLSVNTPAVADAAPTPTLRVPAGMDTPEFGQGLADRVSWMVDNNLNGAKLQVNPPQLGPIEVRIAVQGNHAQVWLTSHSAVTRDALESSSPKLRDMLGAQGFGQVSVDISQRSYQDRSAQPQPYDWTPSAGSSTSPGAAAVQSTASLRPRTGSGAVDAYA
jgi:flagellar hook-length control protein FliK